MGHSARLTTHSRHEATKMDDARPALFAPVNQRCNGVNIQLIIDGTRYTNWMVIFQPFLIVKPSKASLAVEASSAVS